MDQDIAKETTAIIPENRTSEGREDQRLVTNSNSDNSATATTRRRVDNNYNSTPDGSSSLYIPPPTSSSSSGNTNTAKGYGGDQHSSSVYGVTSSPAATATADGLMKFPSHHQPMDNGGVDDGAEDDSSASYQQDDGSNLNLIASDRSLSESSTSNTSSLMHLIKGNLGTGILALPLAFKHAGIWTGLAGIIAFGIVAVHCMHILVKCSYILCKRAGRPTMDYSDVAEYCLKTGPVRYSRYSTIAKQFVNGLLVFTQFGFCCVYIVFIATSIEQVICYFHPNGPGLIVYEIIIAVLLIPYVFVRNLQHLAPFSFFANVLTLIGMVIIIQYIVRDLPDVSTRPAFSNFQDFPLFLGTAFFSVEGISLVLPIENSMKEPDVFAKWNGVLNLGMTIVICLYSTVGFYGYLKLGDDVEGSITLSLPQDNWLYMSVKIMFAVTIFITYGIQFYVPIKIIWPPIKRKLSNGVLRRYGEYMLRAVFVLITFALAAVVPHLDLLISLIGAFASVSLALILPALIDLFTLSAEEGGVPCCVWIKNLLIILIGLLGCVTGTYSALKAIITSF